MKRKNRLFVVAIICGAIGVAWFSWRSLRIRYSPGGKPPAALGVVDHQREPSKTDLTAPSLPDSETREAAMREVREAIRTPIRFFGLVVDREGKPIEGASVTYIVHKRIDYQGSSTIRDGTSDHDGRFAILGENGLMLFVEVSHPAYRGTESSRQSFEYASIGRRQLPLGPTPTEGAPARFVLEKKGTAVELIYHERVECRVPLDGEPVAVDARRGRVGLSTESIIVRLVSDARSIPLNAYKPYDWTAKIAVADVGAIRERQRSEYVAPESDYSSSVTIEMPKSLGRERWSSSVDRDFFVRFATGNWARIEVSASGEGFFVFRTWLNPRGGRNLEFDPQKVVSGDGR